MYGPRVLNKFGDEAGKSPVNKIIGLRSIEISKDGKCPCNQIKSIEIANEKESDLNETVENMDKVD